MSSRNISIFGLGYVGLCTAVSFGQKGIKTIGVDVDTIKVKNLSEGKAPIIEEGLEEALHSTLAKGTFHVTTDPRQAVGESDTSFITVGTPSRPDGSIDLQYVKFVSKAIGEALKEKEDYHLIVMKSTVVPGTSLNLVKPQLEKHSGKRCSQGFGLCMNPEFLQEGSALRDAMNPDRIIIGEHDKRSGDILEEFYRRLHGKETPPIIRTNLSNAEMIKYANNAFLATKISFINTIANICNKTPEADVTVVAKGIGLDHRISPRFLNAGLGYGGSCFPKDVEALIAYSKGLGYKPQLLEATEEVNHLQPLRAVGMLKDLVGDVKGKRFAILGLAFKPGTDDMREAVSIKIIEKLLGEGAEVSAYDPQAKENAKKIFGERITYASSMPSCLRGADGCVIVTEWNEFEMLKPEDLNDMRIAILVDGRRISDSEKFRGEVIYAAIGLGPKKVKLN